MFEFNAIESPTLKLSGAGGGGGKKKPLPEQGLFAIRWEGAYPPIW